MMDGYDSYRCRQRMLLTYVISITSYVYNTTLVTYDITLCVLPQIPTACLYNYSSLNTYVCTVLCIIDVGWKYVSHINNI